MSDITLGIIGSGQLGLLLCKAAKKLNISTVVVSDDEHGPAKNYSDQFIFTKYDNKEKILYASQDGVRSDFNTKYLIKSYLKHPVMTFKIILAIHYEAFKLWTKGIKYIKKNIKIKNNITFEN